MTSEYANVAHGERRAERGHRVAHSPFVKRDDIGVSFAHDGNAATAMPVEAMAAFALSIP